MKFRRKLLCLVMIVSVQRAQSATLENACQQHRVNADSNNQSSQKALQKKFIKRVSSLTERQKKDFIGHLKGRSFNSFDEVLNFLDSFLEVDLLVDLSWGSQIRSLKVNGDLTEEEESFLSEPINDSRILASVRKLFIDGQIGNFKNELESRYEMILPAATSLVPFEESKCRVIQTCLGIREKKVCLIRLMQNENVIECNRLVKNTFVVSPVMPVFNETKDVLEREVNAGSLNLLKILLVVESRYPDPDCPLHKQRALRAIFFNNPEVVRQLEDLGIISQGQGLVGSGVFKERVVSAAVFLQNLFNKVGL